MELPVTMTLDCDAETTQIIEETRKATRVPSEMALIRHALNTYRWLLQRQRAGYKIVVYKGDYEHPEDPQLLTNLWAEEEEAA